MSGDTIGMMDQAFFVGRAEILSWANELLQLNLQKIEQCATGSVYCSIIDSIYPGTVQMSKLKWNAKFDYEYVENYKVLQKAFAKNDIKRHIEVDKLIKAKYQDNLEFCQWVKRFWDLNYNGEPYDAVARRNGQDLYYIAGGNKVNKLTTGTTKMAQPRPKPKLATSKPSVASSGHHPIGKKPVVASGAGASAAVESEQIKQVKSEMEELRINMDTVEKERDFYFGKLRDIEMLL